MNYGSIVTLILTAIAALAVMIPGLDALESSINGLKESKKKESIELCYAIVARKRVPANRELEAIGECRDQKSADIDANFDVALGMISQFRTALLIEQNKAAASAASSPASAASRPTSSGN